MQFVRGGDQQTDTPIEPGTVLQTQELATCP